MKMKLFVLLVASMLLAGPVSGASLSFSFDPAMASGSFDSFGYSAAQGFERWSGSSVAALSQGAKSLGMSHSLFTDVPVPTAAWLFMSGLVGLVGVSRRKKPRQVSQA